jgi:hypothetical protein
MKTTSQICCDLKLGCLSLLTALALYGSGGTAPASVRLESDGGPFYARIERGLVHTDGKWAAIAFYRPPACAPADFNLLDLFDPAAFGCDSFVAGFEIWKHGPWAGEEAPIQSHLNNTGPMPIWFVSWSELQAAMADDVLTVGELAGLPSLLVGTAMSFSETLHPFRAAKQTMVSIVASGVLADGRKFTYQATETHNTIRHVRIVFE